MGARIVLPDADFEQTNIGFLPAVTGASGWWFLNGTLEKASKNLISGQLADVVGLPTTEDGFVSLRGTVNYLVTDVYETASMTMLAVARSAADFTTNPSRPAFVSNYLASTGGAGLNVSAASPTAPAAGVSSSTYRNVNGSLTSGGSTVAVPDMTAWHFFAGVHAPEYSSVYDLTLGISDYDARTGTRVIKDTVAMRLGSSEGTTYGGISDMAFAAVYPRALTTGEVDAVYRQVQAYLSRRGIEV